MTADTGKLRILSCEQDEGLETDRQTICFYSRDSLLRLQFSPHAKIKPDNLPEDLPGIIFDEAVDEGETKLYEAAGGFQEDTEHYSLEIDDASSEKLFSINADEQTGEDQLENRDTLSKPTQDLARGESKGYNSDQPTQVPLYEDSKHVSLQTTGRGRYQHGGQSQRSRCLANSFSNKGRSGWTSKSVMIGSTDSSCHKEDHTDSYPTRKKVRERIFGYKRLNELAESDKSPDVLAVDLLSSKSGFGTMISGKEMQPDWVILLLRILSRVSEAKQRQTLLDLLKLLLAKNFMTCQLIPFLGKLAANQLSVKDTPCLLENIFILCKTSLERLPEEYLSSCKVIIMILKPITDDPDKLGEANQTIQSKFEDLQTILQVVQTQVDDKRRLMTENAKRGEQACEDLPPPDNFKELPILPQLKELSFDEKPFLRANKVKGAYDDLNHYIDVQFRLLREDYIQPLRKGILKYRSEKERGVVGKLQDLRLYQNVRILHPVCNNDGILYMLQFDVSKMANVRWESSRRLLHGSLVCLSQDDFEIMLFATVTQRDVKDLTHGFIQVRFEQDLDIIRSIAPSEVFIMAETTAYFEAYRHILRGLQQIDENMPFQKYIVKCESSTKPPKYLRGQVYEYDFLPLINAQDEEFGTKCPVLNTRSWPNATLLELDESQYRALQMAITKELAIIQGPPGTGKTFVGLKIVRLLLHNKSVWSQDDKSDPLLVVCYTNHALDQFLEGILKFCNSIIRVGGRCQSEALEPFILKNCRRSIGQKVSQSVIQTLRERMWECKDSMTEAKQTIDEESIMLQSTLLRIVSGSTLEKYIDPDHFYSLFCSESKNNHISEWLGLGESSKVIMDEMSDVIDDDPMLSSWKQAIFDFKDEMDTEEAKLILDAWNLQLIKRVGLYKLLIRLVRENLESLIFELNWKKTSNTQENVKKDIDEYGKMIKDLGKNILEEDRLIAFLPQDFAYIVTSLKTKQPMPLYRRTDLTAIGQWLCLDGTEESKQKINEAMKVLVNDDENYIDVDEDALLTDRERIIEEDDDDESNYSSQTSAVESTLDDVAIFATNTCSKDTNPDEWVVSKDMRKK